MLFQALDDKKECVGVFADGRLIYDELPIGLSKTWGYAAFLEDHQVEYASLYCMGKELTDMCPEHLIEAWADVSAHACLFARFCILWCLS